MVTIKNVLLRTNPIEESVLYIKIFKIGFIYFFSRVFCYVNSFGIAENRMHLKDKTTKLLYFFKIPWTSISHHQLLVRDHNKNEVFRLCPQVVVLSK
jgi:hypothetical protein